MSRDTDEDWNLIAADEPFWGVLSLDEYRASEMTPEKEERFYAGGHQAASKIVGHIHRHFEPGWKPKRVLDFGCGVGRLTVPLAQLCTQETVGLDIAEAMLELARKRCEKLKISNCKLALSDDSLSQAPGYFDLVNSFLVLQHIAPERGYTLLDALIEKLTPGGFAAIQIIYPDPSRRRHASESPPGSVSMYEYDLNNVMPKIAAAAEKPVLSFFSDQDGHPGIHLLFRKRISD
jgi:cyclopropane fatty-acyl-phospholipid synthase-like methyltransferase